MGESAPSLVVLTCAHCGAGVAITHEATTRCTHCAHDVLVPETYRAALRVSEQEVEGDALTREAFRTLGAPPSSGLRFVAWLTTGWFAGTFTIAVAYVLSVRFFDWALDRGEPWFHVNAWDWFSKPEQQLVLFGGAFLVILMLFVLGLFGRRRANELRGLHEALSARPPVREGGPVLCRVCGAALTIGSNSRGARCAYCRADNLVEVPAAWLASAKRANAKVVREAKSALEAHRRDVTHLRVLLVVRVVVILGCAALILMPIVKYLRRDRGGEFDLRTALASSRKLFDVQKKAAAGEVQVPLMPDFPANGCASPYLVHPNDDLLCAGEECVGGWFVALRAGDTFEIAPHAIGRARLLRHEGDRTWKSAGYSPTAWGTEIANAPVAPDRPARFVAPTTSWYRVELEIKTDRAISVCAK